MPESNLKPVIKDLIEYYCELPNNEHGGYLHIISSDGNIYDWDITFCREECQKHGDTLGELICDLLLQFTEEEREVMYEKHRWGLNRWI